MTSEILMLNKDAVVIAADSAVTTGRNPHPRYSKAANKIFDLSKHGNVALTIYSSAEIDNVPWELAIKQFRQHPSQNEQLPELKNYSEALIGYLQNNPSLFPATFLSTLITGKFFSAVDYVLNILETLYPDFTNTIVNDGDRTSAWASGYETLSNKFSESPYESPLTNADYENILSHRIELEALLTAEILTSEKFKFADVKQLTQLACEALVKFPTDFLKYTGLVFAGYGAGEIFPSFTHIWVYGHVGNTLLWVSQKGYAITHDNHAWIQPFAQSSMIDRFTDGFDNTLNTIIDEESKTTYQNIISDLNKRGLTTPQDELNSIINSRHKEFMLSWTKKNWDVNFHPLRRVLNSLSVPEMGHLAESLLVLEALRERVTSPSESVGGPIDVAVVTKAEGLIWLKRKHFFDPELNIKYLNRSKMDYTNNS